MDATLAEMASARKPMASDSPSATTPRITGSRSQRRRDAGLVTGFETHETPPSGRRTATDHDDGRAHHHAFENRLTTDIRAHLRNHCSACRHAGAQ